MIPASLAIIGATGRMGSSIGRLVDMHYSDRLAIVARIGSDSGDFGNLANADIVLDVSLPRGTAALVDWLEAHDGDPDTVISGTTGLDDKLLDRFKSLGARRKVLHASNFSPGVAALERILEQAAPMLAELGYTPVLVETHHRHKKDAPSGTALTLTQCMTPYDAASMQVHAIRAGEVVGEHEISFHGDHDRIVVGHAALDRGVFARGAIEAALWLHAQPEAAAFHSMQSYFEARFPRR